MISQTAQYALRAVVCLALQPDVSMTVGQLAELTKVSPEYLSKVMQMLVRADLVVSKPGKAGGFSLKVPASSLSILRVIEAIDPPTHGENCSLELQSYGNILQPLHQKLAQLTAQFRRECNGISIHHLLP